MKVLQINAISRIRSTGRLSAEIADYLNDNGDEGYFAYSSGLPYKKGYKIGTPFEKRLHSLLSRALGTQAYFSKRGTKNLIKYMEDLKPDVVHLGNLHSNFINLKILLTYLSENDIPTVLTLHDCWAFTGKCSHFTVDKCYKWETECGRCPRVKRDNKSWLFDRTKKMYRDKKEWFNRMPRLAVIGVSDWMTEQAKLSFLSSSLIIKRIYNWVDLDIFKPLNSDALRRRLELKDKFVILGVASAWSKSKGLESFLDLAKEIPEDMRIVLVGQINAKVQLADNIIHIDETKNIEEMVEVYSMADVFVQLSVEETFGLVTAEALSCGTPAVVINATANPELVGEGCGFISETASSREILQNIIKVKELGKKNFSANCRNFAKKNFAKEDRVKDYYDVYKEIINSKTK